MSDTPSSCPFCGSYVALLDCGQPCGDSEGNWVAFRCLTSWHRGYHDPRKLQSKTCETVERHKLYDRIKRLEDCAETAWGIIANVDSGSWQEQRADWREAATRWRDKQFHPELSERKAKEAKL